MKHSEHAGRFYCVMFIFKTDLTYLPFSREMLHISPSHRKTLVAVMGGRVDLGEGSSGLS